MHCLQCQHENRTGAKFCEACGSKLELTCPSCGNSVRPGVAFCDNCGAPLARQSQVPSLKSQDQPPVPNPQPPASYTPRHLAERILAEQAAMEARGVTEGERKTITALFADTKDSTALIEDLDPEEARHLIDPALAQRCHEALTLARELSHPYSLAIALIWAACIHQHRREWYATRERGEAAIELCTEQGFAFWLAMSTILEGCALAEWGQGEDGIAKVRQSLASWRATGAEIARPYFLALLAEAHGKVGQAGEGLKVLTEALDMAEKNGERFYEAELYRLKGELSLKSRQVEDKSQTSQDKSEVRSPESEAEECFLKAIEIARKQQAKSLELRAVMSLSRLWQSQGKKEEARQMLAEVYGWLTEGFDTKDLLEAKALLEELGH